MIGDKLVITDYHRNAAKLVMKELDKILGSKELITVTIAGESGSGKTETAHCLAELLKEKGIKSLILGQDDYFKLPPKTNHRKRGEDITWVGPGEVKLNLMDQHLQMFKEGILKITKPLSFYEEDKLREEEISFEGVKVLIAEGTYTNTLKNVDLRAFIDRTYKETKKARLARARDPATAFLEKVLAIEHDIISKHKLDADVIIPAENV